MTDSIYDPLNDDDQGDEAIDDDVAFGERGVDEVRDTSYSPPERPRELDAFGTTVTEQRQGETLEQRLAQEEPDPAMEVYLVEGEPAVRAGEGTLPDDGEDGVLDDGEVGEARAGRLVDPDQGLAVDTEKDLLARDVGIDAGAASAEEAAVHIVDSEQRSIDEGSSR